MIDRLRSIRPYPTPLSWYIDSIRLMEAGQGWEELKRFSPTWKRCRGHRRGLEGLPLRRHPRDLATLGVPGLLMIAGRGGVIQAEDAAEIARLAPNLRQMVASNAGHMVPWDDEADCFRLLGQYLGLQFNLEGA